MVYEKRSPPKLHIRNLQTREGFFAQFNPTQFRRSTDSAWKRQAILGRSFLGLDYLGTNNLKLPLNLFLRAESPAEMDYAENFLNFIESALYPPEQAPNLLLRRPPRLLIVWPKTFSFSAILEKMEVEHELFNIEGQTYQWRVKCSFEEARRRALTQESVRRRGPIRAADLGGDE